MTPEDIAKSNTEHAHQAALFCWTAQHLDRYPELEWLYANANGGERNKIVATRLKAEGVKSGISDITLPVSRRGYHGFYIEMKKPATPGKAAGKESANQVKFGAFVTKQGYLYACFDHWQKAVTALEWYLGEKDGVV